MASKSLDSTTAAQMFKATYYVPRMCYSGLQKLPSKSVSFLNYVDFIVDVKRAFAKIQTIADPPYLRINLKCIT